MICSLSALVLSEPQNQVNGASGIITSIGTFQNVHPAFHARKIGDAFVSCGHQIVKKWVAWMVPSIGAFEFRSLRTFEFA